MGQSESDRQGRGTRRSLRNAVMLSALGFSPQLFPFAPLQILDGILKGLVDTHVAAPAHVPKIPRITIPIPANQTWLPTLNKYLPHNWINLTAVTDLAAKSDDAAVPVTMWNQRISSVLPCSNSDLDNWRTLLLSRKSLMLSCEF
jgi:hypothetical protein